MRSLLRLWRDLFGIGKDDLRLAVVVLDFSGDADVLVLVILFRSAELGAVLGRKECGERVIREGFIEVQEGDLASLS